MISRSLAGSRQDIDIKSEAALKLYMTREDLWSKEIYDIDNDIDPLIELILGKYIYDIIV